MIFISLLVHERPEVVANQVENFRRHMPSAKVVIHVSPSANFTPKKLNSTLRWSGFVENYIVNPQQVESAWGSIIRAHLANIELIASIAQPDDIVAFNSSNDLLCRKGVELLLQEGAALFNRRVITQPGMWWVGETALRDDRFWALRQKIGVKHIIGSQIEGSAYPLHVVSEISRVIQRSDVLQSSLLYPREEIFFSTLAHGLGVQASGLPYIFSSVHRFDRILWRTLNRHRWLFNRTQFGLVRSLRGRLNKHIYKAESAYAINFNDVTRIASGQSLDPLEVYLDDYGGDGPWKINNENGCYGVKRVNRTLSDPIRQFITNIP